MTKLPLEGLRILEISLAWAVPVGMKILADMGAEVIKVESHTRLDVSRTIPFPENELGERYWDEAAQYVYGNPNKKGITLDLTTAKGIELCKKLVERSDVVAENFAPRVLKKFGLDYESLRQVKPDLIMLSSTGYGHSGPWVNYRAYGWGMEPMVGISALTGYVDGPPTRSSIPFPDISGALVGDFAILAALEHRRRTGKGQWIELAQYEVGVSFIGDAVLDYLANGHFLPRIGNRHPSYAPHGCYRCAGSDNWVTIAVTNDEEWRSLCGVMDRAELADDERFHDRSSRWQHQDELDRIIEEWTSPQDHYLVMHRLQEAGVPAGAVLNHKELLLDPQMQARGSFPLAHHSEPRVGTRHHPGPWFQLSQTPGIIRTAAPTLGQHNAEVLGGILGLSRAELDELEDQGIIGTKPLSENRMGFITPALSQQKELGIIEDFDSDYKKIIGLEKPNS